MPRWKDRETPDMFYDPTGRGDGSGGSSRRTKKKDISDWDALMQERFGITPEEWRAAHRASVEWHEAHAAKCAEGLDLSWCEDFDAAKAANEARARWLQIQRAKRQTSTSSPSRRCSST